MGVLEFELVGGLVDPAARLTVIYEEEEDQSRIDEKDFLPNYELEFSMISWTVLVEVDLYFQDVFLIYIV